MLMLHFSNIRWLFLYFLIGKFQVQYIRATWPISNTSNILLLGLFPGVNNDSEYETIALSVYTSAMFKAAVILSQQLNITIGGKFIGWQAAETGDDEIGALISACRVLATSNIIGIVGPVFSRQASMIADLTKTTGIPTISFGATNPTLSHKNVYPAFYRTIPSDYAAALAIVKLFFYYNWTSCIIIYQNDAFGIGGLDVINEEFDRNNLTVDKTLLFDISTMDFRGNLKTILLTSPTRIVIVWAQSFYTSSILQYALDDDVLGPQFLWILCSIVSLNSFNPLFYKNLIGIITIEPTVGDVIGAPINRTLLNASYAIWQRYEPETFPGPTQINNYALFTFDATWTLIRALQKFCSTYINNSSSCLSFVESSFCFDRHFLNTNSFFNAISTTDFLGVSGPIHFSSNTTDIMGGRYYIARNIQPYGKGVNYVSILQWSGSDNWEIATEGSIIIWPGHSLTHPTGRPVLTDVSLRIAVIQIPPFTMTREIIDTLGHNMTKFIGYSHDLIDLLQNMMGFTSQIIVVPINQTFAQTVEGVANNIYDLVVSDITITSERRNIVDFSNSIYDNSLRIIVRETSSVAINFFAFMRPFSPNLWLVIMGTMLCSSILIGILERRTNDELKERSIISLFGMSLWYSFGTMAGYGVDFHVKTAAGRLLSVGLYVSSIVLIASYTANLASELTLLKSKNIISGLDDIKNGKIPYSRIGIVVGGAVEAYYLRAVSGNSRNFYPLRSQSEIFDNLLNNIIDAAITDAAILEYATSNVYCNLTLVGSDFNPSPYGIVMPKHWLYADILDIALLKLRESGDLDELQRKWFQGHTCSTSSETNLSTSFTVRALYGLFVTFAIISIFSLLLFAWLQKPIIKNYLRKLARRKDAFVSKDIDSTGTLSTENSYEPSQIRLSNSTSSVETRL